MYSKGFEGDFGVAGSDCGSLTDDEQVEGLHVASVHNPLDDIKYAELLLRFPRDPQLRNAQTVRKTYNDVRQFVQSSIV